VIDLSRPPQEVENLQEQVMLKTDIQQTEDDMFSELNEADIQAISMAENDQ
jgi:hypothetical protein